MHEFTGSAPIARRWKSLAIRPLPTRFVFRRNLAEELQVLPAHIRPEHGLGIFVRSAPRFHPERGVAQESQRRIGHGSAVAKRHEQAAPIGQHFFGVQVGSADHGPARCQGIRQGAAGNLVFSRIGSDIHIAGLQVLQEVGKAEILVDETHVLADAQRFGHLDQALAIDFAFLALDLRMGGAHDQINGLGTGGHDLGHGLDHVFQPLAAIDESEGANHPPAREPQPRLVRAIALKGTSGTPCGITCTLRPGHAVDALPTAARRLWS